ncbi:hypothetical protein UPYG_G00184370 [Umbra pygmaea]|uniref:RILP-like protein 2 n=1 Tax=Umbra pygmaea TaxID=75934 RepID=A0ABD0WRD2_UMBPY
MEDFRIALDKNAEELTVMDVYDIAAVVGQEFERIIDQFGCDALLRLVPKVVRVLEILEVLVTCNINSETEELRCQLDMLRMERNDRLEKEKMHERDLELAEDVWRREVQDLLSQITQLQVENKSLLKSLSLKNSPLTEEELQQQEGMAERERQMMKKLKEVVNKQRDEVRDKDYELNLKNEDLKALQLQHHHVKKINLDLQHRITIMETQGKAAMQQKAELETMSQVHQQELATLRREVARLKQEHHGWELNRTSAAEESLLKSMMTRPRPALAKHVILKVTIPSMSQI